MKAKPLTNADWAWGDVETYVAPTPRAKGTTAYPFAEMTVGGKKLLLQGRRLSTVRSAIQRYVRAQRARDAKFRRRYVARSTSVDVVTVWRVA